MSTENIVGDASSDINFVIPTLQVGFCFDHKKKDHFRILFYLVEKSFYYYWVNISRKAYSDSSFVPRLFS